MRLVLLKYSFILLIGLLFEWWLVKLSPLNLPDNIPQTPIRISGLLLMILVTFVLIAFQRQLLSLNTEKTILQLTVLGGLLVLIAEAVFQALRQLTIEADEFIDRINTFSRATVSMTIFGAVFSFLVAFQLKTKKTGQLILLIVAALALFNIIIGFFDKTT